ncbi:ArsC/Spx/MgsR family protein [Maritalea porphyrae]|uniref:ArsC/Spx/MgsR family protein n=1 Tax=Maritalea porphyrae TaxID=880732 RepID=UPI0022AF73AB|nr:ArsC/Spx/MgsR family protein [Maritalea porphyrae]MCZ4273501.1 arsenate reductase [Maritalea porphyrae]
MKLYGLKNCDSCRKAKKTLEANGNTVEFVDVRQTPLDDAALSRFLQEFGEEKLVNKKSTTWRQLDEASRALPAMELLKANPSLMKRPVLQTEDGLFLGWAKDVQAHFEQ